MRKDNAIVPVEIVAQRIVLVRGHRVILDRDLAALYGVETRALNQAVKRNRGRFPEDFMFDLSRAEILRISQFVTSSAGLKFSKHVRPVPRRHKLHPSQDAALESQSEGDE